MNTPFGDGEISSASPALSRPTICNGRPAQGLNLLGGDADLLQAVGRDEFLIHGLRNRDLRELLIPDATKIRHRRREGRGKSHASFACCGPTA